MRCDVLTDRSLIGKEIEKHLDFFLSVTTRLVRIGSLRLRVILHHVKHFMIVKLLMKLRSLLSDASENIKIKYKHQEKRLLNSGCNQWKRFTV